MARFGNAGVSSLLSAATAAANRATTYNDSIAGYEYDLSAKTPEDFKTYQDYLKGRASKESDPTKQLTLQKTLTTAYRSFNSAEIGRQSTAVKYGDQSNRDKYSNMLGLYNAAVQNGDSNLAQSLESQLASLSVTIQNEDIAAQNAATAASAKGSSDYRKGVSQAVNEANRVANAVNEAYRTGQELTYVDPNTGKQTTTFVTSNNKDALLGKVKQYQAGVYQQAIDAGQDESGAYSTTLSGIQASPEYIRATNGSQDTLAGNGVNPQLTKFDNYGIPSSSAAPLDKNQVIGTTATGQPIFAPKTGINGSDFIFNRQLSKTATAPGANDLVDAGLTKDAQGNQFYYDPVTGKKVNVTASKDKNGQTVYTHDLANDAGQAAIPTGHELNRQAFGKTVNSIGNAIGGTFNKVAGGVLNFLTGNQSLAQKQAQLKAQADAKSKATSDALAAAAQASLRNLPAVRAATPAPVASYVPTAPKSQLYLPTPIAQTPAQVYKAALPANANDAQKAQALGKSVGYNF